MSAKGAGGWERLSIQQRRALAADRARHECEDQGIPLKASDEDQRWLGRRLATWAQSRQVTLTREAS
jgi:hypothetical protein